MLREGFADLGEGGFLVGEGFAMIGNAVAQQKLSTCGRRVTFSVFMRIFVSLIIGLISFSPSLWSANQWPAWRGLMPMALDRLPTAHSVECHPKY